MNNLRKKYEITYFEEIYCAIIRFIRGTNKIPKWLLKKSRKKYGRKDNLARFYFEKYVGIRVGKYTYGYENLANNNLIAIGSFCSIGPRQSIVPNDHRTDWITTSPVASLKEFSIADKDYMDEYCPVERRKVLIGNDVWIGTDCIIF